MSEFLTALQAAGTPQKTGAARAEPASGEPRSEIGHRFEKMLWAEMLRHAGLEEAFTRSGGEGAAAFSQYMVEAIAEDIASRHPLGLDPVGDMETASAATAYTAQESS